MAVAVAVAVAVDLSRKRFNSTKTNLHIVTHQIIFK
jgi:hypothetical protein